MPQLSLDTQLELHFELMGKMSAVPPLTFKSEVVRQDFVQFCLKQGKKLISSDMALEQYLIQSKNKSEPDSHISNEDLSPEDMNRQKLAILFSHLSMFEYNIGDLTIEPIAPADLIEKIREINRIPDADVSAYLEKLVGEKIPGHQDMSINDFLNGINNCYKKDGVNFHCYLRENFSNPLKADQVKQAESTLSYFMPSVFCQQHINSCEIATTMTMLKKIVTNFNQMQKVCLNNNIPLPQNVIDAQTRIKELEKSFEDALKANSEDTPFLIEDIEDIAEKYLAEIEIIQVQMEKDLAKIIDRDVELFVKKNKNHTLATARHLIGKRIIPSGIEVNPASLLFSIRQNLTEFQGNNLTRHFSQINKEDVVKNIHKPKDTANEQAKFLEGIKKLFLYGKSRLFSESVVCGHSLIMDVDRKGNLQILEHKNNKAESTILSQDGFVNININSAPHEDNAKAVLESLESSIGKLNIELDNIQRIKKGMHHDTEIQKQLDEILEKKSAEVKDLVTIKNDIMIKFGLSQNDLSAQSSKKQFVTLLKGDLNRTTYVETLSKSQKNPQKTVFIFPGNVNHHMPGTTLKSHKTGNGLAKVADQLTSGPNPLPVLSLPTKGMENWPMDPVQNVIVESAVLDIWRAVGAGYDLALPVRERDQKNEYFESGLDSDDAYEPSFWGGVVGGKNLELAEMYRQQLNLVEIIGPVLKSKENPVQFLEQLHNRIGQASPSDDPDVERLANIMMEKMPNPEFLKKMVVSMAAGCNKQANDPWFESTKPMEHDVSALITESKIKQAQIEKELAQQRAGSKPEDEHLKYQRTLLKQSVTVIEEEQTKLCFRQGEYNSPEGSTRLKTFYTEVNTKFKAISNSPEFKSNISSFKFKFVDFFKGIGNKISNFVQRRQGKLGIDTRNTKNLFNSLKSKMNQLKGAEANTQKADLSQPGKEHRDSAKMQP